MPQPLATSAAHAPDAYATLCAEKAFAAMQSVSVPPTPQNYSVFYACAAGQSAELAHEMEALTNTDPVRSAALLETLYETYIAEPQARALKESAASAKKILSDMMHNVAAFAGSTVSAGKQVENQLQQLDENASEEMVRMLATRLMQSAGSIKDSSDSMTHKLAGAQKEIMDLRENLARAVTEAERDFLTGAYNRKAFDTRLIEAIAEARDSNTELSLLMIDIDHFKRFNDSYGHLIGDEVIKIVAKVLIDTLKGTDCVARYGGEEFAVILPRTPLSGAGVVGEIIRKSIATKELKRKSTGENFGIITVSVGTALLRPATDDAHAFIARADNALYRAKAAGRNRVVPESN